MASEFVLKLEPAERVAFSGKKLGEEPTTVTLKITNPTKERHAYKVKCTSNEMFRIRPPVGAIKAGESVSVALVFNAGKSVPDSGKHYFAVYYIKSTDEKKAPRAAWSEHKGDPTGTKRLYVDFKKDGDVAGEKKEEEKKDGDKKEEKKDEEKKEEKKEEKEEKKEEEKKDDEKKEEKKEDEKKDEDKKEEEKKDEEKKDEEKKEEDKKEE
ncbi:hypothetical protein L596_020352 [Steinernema carpocapsae]|uniref:Major sperm protein n=1 Tax=Steinernema carpocapsae TaxID=34508 RepID=A0A4U5MTF1_STECR|nr:hypothetical protein L596_020352 [Steinernema carpocapsae]